MAGDFTSAWTLALRQKPGAELAESVEHGDGVVLGLRVVHLLVRTRSSAPASGGTSQG